MASSLFRFTWVFLNVAPFRISANKFMRSFGMVNGVAGILFIDGGAGGGIDGGAGGGIDGGAGGGGGGRGSILLIAMNLHSQCFFFSK